ncbi:potassium transporter Kup [Sinorhizobium medicae]|uniref:Probable potassium transport system protein Kup 2 n=8 Tax=Sinorhizobium medicae TaxID=110321 RepID=KUP2_SINMW|nr:potassium transporter Kup [Sinorhizobium medicae]A6UM20.1 RecName: Full=Probable potassium transport system protein Kup 2 [Sinorhizobium medicae WSM419]ABR64700.1 K potassium transporter [Sinorhizobium medicae WSM419]MBO1945014.1 potassium transporter Kup [Sinorhizobium medicae]MDX0409172.1 potassium transporter Kup [Sinorhizobium medicae]MDX0421170.1 potassium transporter Kup [Sinorhizobium medicae]MDX0427201.1 potassium transporter Kup [Sinorhizobium medicae]
MADSLDHAPAQANNLPQFLAMTIGAIGVVYGDIGTSPLYAFREALRPFGPDGVERAEVVGLISLMLWTLTIIVTFKYVLFLLRADNDGEGGTLSLLALLMKKAPRYTTLMFMAGILGAALFIGDAMITPALSVLSAVEGLKLVTPAFHDYVLPISVGIMVLLFAVQSRGTGAVSIFFGPITLIWFLVLGAAGVAHIGDDLAILAAFNPVNAVTFLWNAGFVGFIVLGAVFLTVTGAEALYADLGHFGRGPIQAAWFAVVFPALTLNYLGQGALVLSHPEAVSDPFFLMFPNWALLPVVLLATAATIIASQAVITGAFSLVRQAINLGFLPRFEICFTSETQTGQIYLPFVNNALLAGVIVLMFMFGSSESLATAYGISVTGAMVVTTVLAFEFARHQWGWSTLTATAVLLPLLVLELFFLGANLFKIHDGGYVPILIAGTLMTTMWTWRKGVSLLREKTARQDIPLSQFMAMVERKSEHAPVEVPGTAIFLTATPDTTPAVLLHNIKHNHVLHQHNVILTIKTARVPYVPEKDRYTIEKLSDRFSLLELRFGFMDDQNVSRALARCRKEGFKFEIMSTSFYLGRRKLIAAPQSGLPQWQDKLFIAMADSAIDPTEYFHLPPNRVVELGEQVVI